MLFLFFFFFIQFCYDHPKGYIKDISKAIYEYEFSKTLVLDCSKYAVKLNPGLIINLKFIFYRKCY